MPRTTRAARARKAEERVRDDYSDIDCDSVVEPRAHACAVTTQARDSINAAEELRAQRGASLVHTLGGAQTGAPAAALDTDTAKKMRHVLCGAQTGAPATVLNTVMESFARMQAETNRKLM